MTDDESGMTDREYLVDLADQLEREFKVCVAGGAVTAVSPFNADRLREIAKRACDGTRPENPMPEIKRILHEMRPPATGNVLTGRGATTADLEKLREKS